MVVSRLQKFDGRLTAQGTLLLNGPLLCSEGGSNSERNTSMAVKPRQLQVFLFEQCIIFSEIVGKNTEHVDPSYVCKNHIQVNIDLFFIKLIFENDLKFWDFQANKMVMEELPEKRLLIRSSDPQRQEVCYIIIPQSDEQFQQWMGTITNILQTQQDFVRAIQSPIAYQMELTKES